VNKEKKLQEVIDSILGEDGNKPCLDDERNYNILAVSK
jgi:hypothetical protein